MITAKEVLENTFTDERFNDMSKMDKKGVFSYHTNMLKSYDDTVKLHQKNRPIKKDKPEYDEYQALYEEIDTHYNYIYDYVMHFDYYSCTSKDKTVAYRTFRAHLRSIVKLLNKLKDLDHAYAAIEKSATGDEIDLDFWETAPYLCEAKDYFSINQKRRKITLASVALVAICTLVFLLTNFTISNTRDGLALKRKHTTAGWYYLVHENITPTATNVIHLDDNDCDIILGKTTLKDLQKAGFEYGYEDYEDTYEKGGKTYTTIHHQFSYQCEKYYSDKHVGYKVENPNWDLLSYDTIIKRERFYPYGTGSVELVQNDNYAVFLYFETYQDCVAKKLDLSKCYINSIEIVYEPDSIDKVPFEYLDFTNDVTVDSLTQMYGSDAIVDYYKVDKDKNGIDDLEKIEFYLSNHETLSYYHIIPETTGDTETYSINITTQNHNLR